jgi:U5 snRNP spliceosome subunit
MEEDAEPMDTSEGTAPPKEPPPPQVEPPPMEQSSTTMEPPPPHPPTALTKMIYRAKGKLRMPSPERPAEVPLDPLHPRHQSSKDSLLPRGQLIGVVERTPGHQDRLGVVSETPAAAALLKVPAKKIQAILPELINEK